MSAKLVRSNSSNLLLSSSPTAVVRCSGHAHIHTACRVWPLQYPCLFHLLLNLIPKDGRTPYYWPGHQKRVLLFPQWTNFAFLTYCGNIQVTGSPSACKLWATVITHPLPKWNPVPMQNPLFHNNRHLFLSSRSHFQNFPTYLRRFALLFLSFL